MKKTARNHHSTRQANLILLLALSAGAVVMVIATLMLPSHKTQETTSKPTPEQYAKPTAKLSFGSTTTPSSPLEVNEGETAEFTMIITPNNHKISSVTPIISYNSEIFEFVDFQPNTQVFPTILQPVDATLHGTISVSLGITPPLDNAVTSPVTIGTLQLKALKKTSSEITTVEFDSQSQALSVDPLDGPSTNVISDRTPLHVKIN